MFRPFFNWLEKRWFSIMFRGGVDWLETHWVLPAYSGGVLLGIGICFFGAATNTMAGWLYVLSGLIFALLGLNGVMAMRSLPALRVRRSPLDPVTVGDELEIRLEIENPSNTPQLLLQVWEQLPPRLGKSKPIAIELIPPKTTHHCTYYHQAQHRGVYQWHNLELRTGSPLGLFWCRRLRHVPGKAIVYPTVLPLSQCPLIDTIGLEESNTKESDRRSYAATQGLTKALRPYRIGDPTRLIHWRTSAKLGQLQVRELEIMTSGRELIICLDHTSTWPAKVFEQAVIAAASLYFYANRQQLSVQLWTAGSGLVKGHRLVLETLAAVSPEEECLTEPPTQIPVIWLTPNLDRLNNLIPESCWFLFGETLPTNLPGTGLLISGQAPLQTELQQRPALLSRTKTV